MPACFCSPYQSPSGQSPLRKKARGGDSDSDSELDLIGSGAGSKSPKVRGEKGAASFTSIADAADHIATRLATGLMDAVSSAAQALQVGGQAKLNAMQEIASGMQSKLNAKLEEIQAISDGIKAQMRACERTARRHCAPPAAFKSFTNGACASIPRWAHALPSTAPRD